MTSPCATAAALLIGLASLVSATTGTATVLTPFGIVLGNTTSEGTAFFDIPFARPPVGSLRWKAPQPWTGLFPGGIHDGRINNNITCAQRYVAGLYAGSKTEDCLVLSIYRPSTSPLSLLERSRKPVIIFIHGGAFTFRNTARSTWDGRLLAQATDSVVVGMNYRLGAFGFFALDELAQEGATGNYGLMDQELALNWIQDNIQYFGGNPDLVTLWGQSAGAQSVIAHVARNETAGLFKAAIAQSATHEVHTLAGAKATSKAVIQATGKCSGLAGSAFLTCIRALNTTELLSADTTPILESWGPVLDGVYVAVDPIAQIDSGYSNHVPLIMSTVPYEGFLWAYYLHFTAALSGAAYQAAMASFYKLNDTQLAAALALYPPNALGADNRALWMVVLSDTYFVCPTRKTLQAAQSWMPTWAARFTGVPPCWAGIQIGAAVHGDDLQYVFNHLETPACGNFDAANAHLVTVMQNIWGNFAVNGTVNGSMPIGALWPMFPGNKFMTLAPAGLSWFTGLRDTNCNFWDSIAWSPVS